MNTNKETNESDRKVTSLSALCGRVFLFFLGPAALLLTTYGIVTNGSGWLTGLDLTFFVLLALMILGRWTGQRLAALLRGVRFALTTRELR